MSAGQVYVIPAEGLMVPDPAVKGSSDQVRVPPEGKWVDPGPYWDRRERHGDVRFGEPPAAAAATTTPTPPTPDTTTTTPGAPTAPADANKPTKNALRAKDGDA